VPILGRRSVPLTLAGLLLAVIIGPTIAGATGPVPDVTSLASATSPTSPDGLKTRTNRRRNTAGLVVVRNDPDLARIARDRARVMAQNDKMDHTEPDGTTVFDRIRNAGLTWYGAGEIIAWNSYSGQKSSVKNVISAWMNSSGHRSIMLSSGYNYVGFGMSISSSGKRYFAGVFAKEPDETGARTELGSVTRSPVDGDSVRVKVRWSGKDPRLQVLTAGLGRFEVQRRRVGGDWTSWTTTTATSKAVTWLRDEDHEVRVRARDKRGNWGKWKSLRVKL
jgi:uncharacterized protein YkwD